MFSFYDQQISRPRASGFVASLVPLYVGNLDSTVTESMLFNIFSQKDIPPDMYVRFFYLLLSLNLPEIT